MSFRVFLVYSVILAVNANAKIDDMKVDYMGAKLEMLTANILEMQARVAGIEKKNVQLEEKNYQLELKNTELEKKVMSKSDLTDEIFDCYRTDDWSTEGVITFNGCSVDTTTGAPWNGTFVVREPGIYRLTFMGQIGHSNGAFTTSGDVYLRVDGVIVASARQSQYNDYTYSATMLSINTLQTLDVGQVVTIEFEAPVGRGYVSLESDGGKYVHFTGQLLGSAAIYPPQCEFTGQSFEYPGSCRKYYICLADGTVDIFDCCPDVYSPVNKACVSEADGNYLCHDEDNCSSMTIT